MDTTDATLDRMHGLARDWETRSDRRCIFLGCYALMTANMLQAINRSRFRDGLWVDHLLHFDLVFTLVDVLTPEWPGLSETERRARYDDHCLVNTIIAETVDTVQDQVIERHAPRLDIVDKGLGRLDEWFISRLIMKWRSDVWTNATQLLGLSHPARRSMLHQNIEQAALRRGQEILDVWRHGAGASDGRVPVYDRSGDGAPSWKTEEVWSCRSTLS